MTFFDLGDTNKLHEQVSEYTRILSQTVRIFKPTPSVNREVFDVLFSLFGQALCYRDELDQYLLSRDGEGKRSILNSPCLDNYAELFEYLSRNDSSGESLVSNIDLLEAPEDHLPSEAIPGSVSLISMCLCTFGASEDLAVKHRSWVRLRDAYFPYLSDVYLRQMYYSHGLSREHSSPLIWSLSEDYVLVAETERFGMNIHSLNAVYLALHETRTLDEIYLRMQFFFNKSRKKKRKIVCESSDWSVDDTLLV